MIDIVRRSHFEYNYNERGERIVNEATSYLLDEFDINCYLNNSYKYCCDKLKNTLSIKYGNRFIVRDVKNITQEDLNNAKEYFYIPERFNDYGDIITNEIKLDYCPFCGKELK
jgi:hypothetical protein